MAMSPQQVWSYCDSQEYIDHAMVEKFRQELPSNDGTTITIGLGAFTTANCPKCGASGYYRFHFLGKLQHPACSSTWYVSPGKYLAVQMKRTFHVGMEMATQDSKDNDGAGAKIATFVFGAIFRLCFGLITAPVQAVVSFASRARSK